MIQKEKAALLSKPAQIDLPLNFNKKIDRIRAAIRLPDGLNRFEAERIGDHCLNSTIAKLRERGEAIHSEWEVVPTRYNPGGVRVLRYRITPAYREAA